MAGIAYQSGNLGGGSSGEAWSVRVDNDGKRYLVVEEPRHNNLRSHETKRSPGGSAYPITQSNSSASTTSNSNTGTATDIQWCKDQIRKLSNNIGNSGARSELNDLNIYFTEWKNSKTSSLRERQARRIRSRFVKEASEFVHSFCTLRTNRRTPVDLL